MKGNCGECTDRWFCDINPDECDAWPDPMPLTNGDRIRTMSDEELAEFLEGIHACSNCMKRGNNCFPHWDALEWLQQPAEEEFT